MAEFETSGLKSSSYLHPGRTAHPFGRLSQAGGRTVLRKNAQNSFNFPTGMSRNNYQWDAANRLTEIDYLDSTSKTVIGSSLLSYDAFGRLVRICENAESRVQIDRRFIWAGNELIQERDAQGNVVKEYFSQGFDAIKETSGARPGLYYYGQDQLGSIRNLTGKDGENLAQFDYGPYGERLQRSHDDTFAQVRPTFCGETQTDFGYTGLLYHQRSGLNLALHRAYDSSIKRWLSRDPLINPEVDAGPNIFTYLQNRPLNFMDPTGLNGYCCGPELCSYGSGPQGKGPIIVKPYQPLPPGTFVIPPLTTPTSPELQSPQVMPPEPLPSSTPPPPVLPTGTPKPNICPGCKQAGPGGVRG